MLRILLFASVLSTGSLAFIPPAEASASDNVIAAGVLFWAFVPADLFFICADVLLSGRNKHPSLAFAITEVVLATTEATAGTVLWAVSLQDGYDGPSLPAIALMLVGLPFLIHGLWALATQPEPPPRITFGPTPIFDGRRIAYGFTLGGSF